MSTCTWELLLVWNVQADANRCMVDVSQVEREIRIHSSLDHKNIIRLYAAFEDDSNVYMVQEYATGNIATRLPCTSL